MIVKELSPSRVSRTLTFSPLPPLTELTGRATDGTAREGLLLSPFTAVLTLLFQHVHWFTGSF